MRSREVVVTSTGGKFEQSVTAGPHRFLADEPTEYGGRDTGPNPYELMLAALGTCTSMTLEVYARRKSWPLEGVLVRLTHERVHADDCASCEEGGRRLTRIERRITLEGPLSEEQQAKLIEIAEKCPVHKTLTGALEIRTSLDGAPAR